MIVLDTHVWLWWLHNPQKLSPQAQTLINQEEQNNGLRVSAISVWEIAVKVGLGKLVLPMQINNWYAHAKAYPSLRIIAVNPSDAIASTQLPGTFHKDPADRIIIALARRLKIPLITCDRKILDYPYVTTIW